MSVRERQAARRNTDEQGLRDNIRRDNPTNLKDIDIHVDGVPLDEMRQPLADKLAKEADELRRKERPLANINEARAVMSALEEHGEEGLGEEKYANGMNKVKRFLADNPEALEQLREEREQNSPEAKAARKAMQKRDLERAAAPIANDESFASDYLRQLTGLGSVAGSVVNSAFLEPIAGLRGLWGLTIGGKTNDEVVEDMEAFKDAWTLVPVTEEGKVMLETIAEPLARLDERAMDIAADTSGFLGGNEMASTMIYTTLMAIPELAGFRGGSVVKNLGGRDIHPIKSRRKGRPDAPLIVNQLRKASEAAEKLGVSPVQQTLPSDIIKATKKMSSSVAAANASQLQNAMVKAKQVQRARLEKMRSGANKQRAFVNVEEAARFADDFQRRAIENGDDLAKMPVVRERLKEIQDLQKSTQAVEAEVASKSAAFKQTAADTAGKTGIDRRKAFVNTASSTVKIKSRRVQDWITIRNRIDKHLESTRNNPRVPETTNERTILNRLKNEMDANLQHQFNNDMIDGSPDAIQMWRDYDVARNHFNETFHTDKVIMRLIEQEAGPEQIKRWVMGANAANMNPQMHTTMNRIKQVLGPDHPAIRGIQLDFMYDVVRPMFATKGPNFDGLIRNIDNVTQTRREVLRAMDIDVDNLKALRSWAKVAKENPPSATVKLINDGAMLLARMSPFAHSIAKQGAKVSLLANVFRKMSGKHTASQKKLLAEFSDAQWGEPVFSKGGMTAGRILQGAVLADLSGIVDENVEREE